MDRTLTYDQLLELPEWKRKRETILKRDKLICQHCENRTYEEQGHYGPYPYPKAAVAYVTFSCFNGQVERIYAQDEKGTGLISEWAMLYMVKHRSSGIEDEPREGYFVAAARELSPGEIDYYFPFTKPGLSPEQRFEAIKEFNSLAFRNDPHQKELIENKGLIDSSPKEYKWIFAKDLHVHHTYYRIDKQPWEYPDDSLITLCRSCHEKVHETEEIPVLDERAFKIGNYMPCYRCKGAGWFPEYRHIQRGICFACKGKTYLDSQFINPIKSKE